MNDEDRSCEGLYIYKHKISQIRLMEHGPNEL